MDRKRKRDGDENQKPPKRRRYSKESSEEDGVVPSKRGKLNKTRRVLTGVQQGRRSVGLLSTKAKAQLVKMKEERVEEAATTESKKELQKKKKEHLKKEKELQKKKEELLKKRKDILPHITGHPLSRIFELGREYIDLNCNTTRKDGWKKQFKWLRFDDKVESTSYETADRENRSRLTINFPDKNAPDAKSLAKDLSGDYQCEVTFKETYRDDEKKDHPVVLWSRSKPATIAEDVEETRVQRMSNLLQDWKQSEGSTSRPGCAAVARHAVSAKKFCDLFTKFSITAAAFCDAFMETREPASDWMELRKCAGDLISANWESKAKCTSCLEEKCMQPLVRLPLEEAVGMEIKHTGLNGFGRNRPDGVIYGHSRAIAIVEIKLRGGAGDEKVQMLDYGECYGDNTLKKKPSLYPEGGQAFPCFLISVRGKLIHLYGAIHLPESTSPQSWRIHYGLLAVANFISDERDECAKFLSKLKKGLKLLKQFWFDGGKSMRFDLKGYPLPCDCVAEQLHKEFHFTGHLSRNVFTGQLGKDTYIAKLAESGYGEEAHRSCAKEGVAPSLITFKQFHFDEGQFCGVLMEKLKEEFIPLDQAFLTWELMKAAVVNQIKEGIKKALKVMHSKSLVHGDLRAPNVFVSEEGEVRVIDFDWSGLEDTKTYPDVNYCCLWPEGVWYQKPLQKTHDWCLFHCHCLVLDRIMAEQAN